MNLTTARIALSYLANIEAEAIARAGYDRSLTSAEKAQAKDLWDLSAQTGHGTQEEHAKAEAWLRAQDEGASK